MWRSDPALVGPVRATAADIDPLNRIFSDAFTERYRRDGLSGVRVPFLNPVVWQFAIDDASEGAMLWRDARGDIVAFNMVHRSGSEGWMGPLAVRTDRQGEGHGGRIVRAGIDWLKAQGVRTIGLETMPRTIDNIGFYSKIGFLPDHLTITLQRDQPRGGAVFADRMSGLSGSARETAIAACRAFSASVVDGVDFTREIDLTLHHQLGDLSMVRSAGGDLQAMVLWHTVPLALGRPEEDLRILKLVARDTPTAIHAIAAVEREAADRQLARLSLRCQTRHHDLYAALIAAGFRVQWTDLRMTLAGHRLQERSGVMLSNWEI